MPTKTDANLANKLAVAGTDDGGGKPALQQMIELNMPQIERALPSAGLTPERFTRILLTEVRRNPQLARCKPVSIISAAMVAAQLGLEIGGPLGQAYLVPFRDEATFILGYRGMIDLARRSGTIKSIVARPVHENDEFDYSYGLDETLIHRPAMGDRGPAIAYYGVARYKDGGHNLLVMSKADIEARRKRSASSRAESGPWTTDYDAMACKGLALDTPIPTPHGWTSMGEIEVGDEVFDMDGNPSRVLAVSAIKNIDCYRVTFGDGTSIVCDHEHRWWASLPPGVRKGRRNGVRRGDLAVHSVVDLYEAKSDGRRVTVPVAAPLDLPDADLPVHPYVLGLWLGDGSRSAACISTHADDLDEVVDLLRRVGAKIGTVRLDPRGRGAVINLRELRKELADLGVLGDKHVPPVYLRGSFEQRLDLLRGLMDSDGTADKRNRAIFGNTNRALADAVAELACSLGQVVTRMERQVEGFGRVVTAYSVSWTPSLSPFSLARKSARVAKRTYAPYRGVASVETVPSVPTRCIAVESPTSSYLAGERMVPTHNTVIRAMAPFLPLEAEHFQAISVDGATPRRIDFDLSDLAYEAEDDEPVDAEVVGEEPLDGRILDPAEGDQLPLDPKEQTP